MLQQATQQPKFLITLWTLVKEQPVRVSGMKFSIGIAFERESVDPCLIRAAETGAGFQVDEHRRSAAEELETGAAETFFVVREVCYFVLLFWRKRQKVRMEVMACLRY